jgi:hypothetical protein
MGMLPFGAGSEKSKEMKNERRKKMVIRKYLLAEEMGGKARKQMKVKRSRGVTRMKKMTGK